jgi:predicted Zn-dependent peptidase
MVEVEKEVFFVLSNGAKVVLSNANSLVSHIGLLINVGSRDELPGQDGVMHMIEHLLFKGTKTKSYYELMNYIESVGGDMNAYTSKEETCIYISIQNQYLERAVEVLQDIFFNSSFSEVEFNKEREVVLDELNSYKDSPNELIFDEFEEAFFGSHDLASNILGNEKSLAKMNLKNVDDAYKQNYIPKKLIVSYVGGVDLIYVRKLIQDYFDIQQNEVLLNCKDRIPFLEKPSFSIMQKRDTFQSHCMIGSIAPSMYDESKTTMVLLNNLLGGSCFNAMLNLSLREERGLTYNIESNYTAYSDTGIFTIYFGTDVSKVKMCKDVIFEMFDSIIKNGLPIEKLEMYKQQLIGQVALSFDNYVSLLISNAKSYMCYDRVDSYAEIIEKIEKINNSEIIKISEEVLNSSNISSLEYN